MTDWLAAQTAVNPYKTFVRFKDQAYSFSELNDKAGTWASQLKALGVNKQDVVAVLLTNRLEYVELCFAVMRLGAILLPLNTRLTQRELEYQVKKTKAKLLISSQDLFEAVVELKNSLPCYLLEDLKVTKLEPILSSELNLEATFCIMFTSGTTGQPKGVCLSLQNFFYSANASAYRLGLQAQDVWLCAMPLYHVGGLSIVLRSCLYGTQVLLHAKFDFTELAKDLADEAHRVTLVSLVPTMLYRLLQLQDFRAAASLRLILLGGAAASSKLLQDAQSQGLKVVTTYGLTEACSQVATLSPDSVLALEGQSSVGTALMFSHIKVVNDAGEALPASEAGEILVKGPTVMLGYFDDEAATQRSLKEGYLHTGDIGYLDAKGKLFVQTRRSDLIVSGGENVYPSEVEAVLEKHASIDKVCVLGLEDNEWGQRVAAAIITKEHTQQEILKEELELLCKQHLAAYKRPRSYFFVTEFPLTASGKIKRQDLKSQLERSLV